MSREEEFRKALKRIVRVSRYYLMGADEREHLPQAERKRIREALDGDLAWALHDIATSTLWPHRFMQPDPEMVKPRRIPRLVPPKPDGRCGCRCHDSSKNPDCSRCSDGCPETAAWTKP